MRDMIMDFPVEYVESCTKDMENIAGVYKPNYFPIPLCLMKPLEKKSYFMASSQEFFRGVNKQ